MRLKFWQKSSVRLERKSVDLPSLLTDVNIREGVAKIISDTSDSYLKNGYEGNADVYSIVNKIVRMASQARLALYTKDSKGKWIEVTDHPLNAFIRKVNPQNTTSFFQEGHLIYKLCVGNSYWWKPVIENGINKGKTLEIWLLPVNAVTIEKSLDWMNPVKRFVVTTNDLKYFSPEEINHSKFFNPDFINSAYGMSPLKAAARIVTKQNQGEVTQIKQMENQAPPYILYRDVNDQLSWNNEQTGQLEEKFKDYSKKMKVGHPFVSPEKIGMIQMGVSPVDLQIIESSKEGKRALCSVYGIDSNLFNDKESSTYNNMKEVKRDAWINCIKPNLKEFDDSLNSFLIDPVEEYRKQGLFFARDYSEVDELQADRALMITWMKQAALTPNEIREAVGYNPINNPLMDEPWMPMGETPLSLQVEEPLSEETPVKNFDYK